MGKWSLLEVRGFPSITGEELLQLVQDARFRGGNTLSFRVDIDDPVKGLLSFRRFLGNGTSRVEIRSFANRDKLIAFLGEHGVRYNVRHHVHEDVGHTFTRQATGIPFYVNGNFEVCIGKPGQFHATMKGYEADERTKGVFARGYYHSARPIQDVPSALQWWTEHLHDAATMQELERIATEAFEKKGYRVEEPNWSKWLKRRKEQEFVALRRAGKVMQREGAIERAVDQLLHEHEAKYTGYSPFGGGIRSKEAQSHMKRLGGELRKEKGLSYLLYPEYYGHCAHCRQDDSKMWLTSHRQWSKLPLEHRDKVLCVNCFRKLSNLKEAHDITQKVYSEAVDHLLEGVQVTSGQARRVAERIGANKVDLEQLRRGLEVEQEHGDKDKQTDVVPGKDAKNLDTFGKIALAHLKEIPDYYTRLAKMEKVGKKAVKEAVEHLLREDSIADTLQTMLAKHRSTKVRIKNRPPVRVVVRHKATSRSLTGAYYHPGEQQVYVGKKGKKFSPFERTILAHELGHHRNWSHVPLSPQGKMKMASTAQAAYQAGALAGTVGALGAKTDKQAKAAATIGTVAALPRYGDEALANARALGRTVAKHGARGLLAGKAGPLRAVGVSMASYSMLPAMPWLAYAHRRAIRKSANYHALQSRTRKQIQHAVQHGESTRRLAKKYDVTRRSVRAMGKSTRTPKPSWHSHSPYYGYFLQTAKKQRHGVKEAVEHLLREGRFDYKSSVGVQSQFAPQQKMTLQRAVNTNKYSAPKASQQAVKPQVSKQQEVKEAADQMLAEGFFKDMLFYDLSRHHPRAGRRAEHMRPASSKPKPAYEPMGRYNPATVYPEGHPMHPGTVKAPSPIATTASSSAKAGTAKKLFTRRSAAVLAVPLLAVGGTKAYEAWATRRKKK